MPPASSAKAPSILPIAGVTIGGRSSMSVLSSAACAAMPSMLVWLTRLAANCVGRTISATATARTIATNAMRVRLTPASAG
jgi:hypothetical protein